MMSTNNRIFFLTGIKHSGKSNVGRKAAAILHTTEPTLFIDVDDVISNAISSRYSSIRSFYQHEGKEAFMREEMAALQTILSTIDSNHTYIIATGGGACDNEEMVTLMKQQGTILYLLVKEEALLNRIKKKGIPPFLDSEDIEGSFHTLFIQRSRQYRHICDFMVSLEDFKSVEHNGEVLASFIAHI